MFLADKKYFSKIMLSVVIVVATQLYAVDKYRFVVNVSGSSAGDPVIANIDFPRWLLLDDMRNPVNQRSVKVYALPSETQIDAVMDSNLASPAYHYENGLFVRFKAVSGVTQYAIEFETADKFSHALPPDFYPLGIGELLRYDYTELNPVWGGWSGTAPTIADADNDGDWDLYLKAYDGGEFVSRNIGDDDSPVFLPPVRYTEYDQRVQPASSPYYIDWNDDGYLDKLAYTAYEDGYTEGAVRPNYSAYFTIQLNSGGIYDDPIHIVDSQLEDVTLERARWIVLSVMDVDNDGKDDILASGASNYIVVLLNKGFTSSKPYAEKTFLPISGDNGSGMADDHQIEEMATKCTPFDWDGDGDKDIFISGWNHSVYYLENTAVSNQMSFKSPVRFEQYGGPINNGDCGSPCMLDWDGDGDLDLMEGGAVGQIVYCENTGTRSQPQFAGGDYLTDSSGEIITVNAESTNGTIQGSEETYWGYLTFDYCDWDNDSDYDLITNDSLGRLSLRENVGSSSAGVLSSDSIRFREQADIDSDVYAYWNFNGNFNDSSGSGIDLASAGSGGVPSFTASGLFEGCYVFDNQTTGYANCLGGVISIGENDPFTVTAWINPTHFESGFSDTAPHTIAKLFNTGEAVALDLRIRDSKLDVYYTNPSINYTTDVEVPLNQWSFVSVTYYRNVIKIFFNGEVVCHEDTNGGQGYNRIYIGAASASTRGFNGKIDDIKIYSRELKDIEVMSLASRGASDNLTGLWRFEQNLKDSSGGHNDLASVGSGGTPGLTSTGILGNGCLLDNSVAGSPQCLRANVSIDSTTDVSMLLWVKPSSLSSGFSTTSPHTMMRLINSSNGNEMNFRIRDSKLDVYYSYPSANHLSSQTVSLNQWCFVGVVQSGQEMKIYYNGELVYSGSVNGSLSYDRLYIGSSDESTSRGINGLIDEARLYECALSEDEIKDIYEYDKQERAIKTPWRNRPGVGDITGDNKINILALDSSGRLGIYTPLTSGGMVLELENWVRDSQSDPIVVCPFDNNQLGRTQVDLADWDGDNDLDIIYGQDWGMLGFNCSLQYMQNTGSSTSPVFSSGKLQAGGENFVEWTGNNGKHNGHSAHPEMVDFDNDGDMDLLVGTESGRITYYNHDYFSSSSFPDVTISEFQKLTADGWLGLSSN
ncbi:MAG: LamG-like jellyroll fold domain-containing protein [Sedimentisphaeraceae bacterium JB056]